jgi:hypothetical protein
MTTRKKTTAESSENKTEKQPYMSEYDKGVEVRLQEFESNLEEIISKVSGLEDKFEDLILKLSKKMSLG